jgi:hypothetical protein
MNVEKNDMNEKIKKMVLSKKLKKKKIRFIMETK